MAGALDRGSVESVPWPASHAAVVGFFSGDHVLREVVRFGDLAEALRAGRERGATRSVVVWTDDHGVPHSRWVGCDPLPRDLADAMYAAGYGANGTRRRDRWEQETKFMATEKAARQPKEKPMTEQPTDDEAAAIIRAERKAGKLLARLGLNRRAALAYREVADLRAAGATAEAIEAAEQVAQTLTDLALADLDDDG